MQKAFPHRYISIEGPIGVGKTTLTKLLCEELNAQPFLEEFEDNPFLRSFYEDPKTVAFQTQVYFLMARYKQQQRLEQPDLFSQRVVSDYIFAKDRIFAYLNLQDEEIKLYEKIYDLVGQQTLKPDLVVYLSADVDTLMQRIHQRGRNYEDNVDPDYLHQLMKIYGDFFSHYSETPLLMVDTTHLNFPERPEDYHLILEAIASTTEGTRHLQKSCLT